MKPCAGTRWSSAQDAEALARIHAEAWRFAYAGILPSLALERRIAARCDRYWRDWHGDGGRTRLVTFGTAAAGYALIGRAREAATRKPTGEIYELYLDPVWHGAGLGTRLFADARKVLQAAGMRRLIVWALTDNEPACRLYRRLGGRIVGETWTRMEGSRLRQRGFGWQ